MEHFRAIAPFVLKSVEDSKAARVIEGTATKTATDSNGDVLESKGAVFKLPMPLLMQHDRREPVGEVTAARVTATEITIRATFAPADAGLDYVERAWKQVKAGLVRGLSIGARPLKAEPILDSNGRMTGTRYTAWKWLERSAVTLPMNESATIANVLAVVRADYARLKQRDRRAAADQAIDALATMCGRDGERQRRARIVADSLREPPGVGQRNGLRSASEQRQLDEMRARAAVAFAVSAQVLGSTRAGRQAIEAAQARNSVEAITARARADAQVALLRSGWVLEDTADRLALGKAAAILSPDAFALHSETVARARVALRGADRSTAATLARCAIALESQSPAVKYQATRGRVIAALEASRRALANQ